MGSQAPKGSLQSKCWVQGTLCIHVCRFVYDDGYVVCTCGYCTCLSVSTTLNRLDAVLCMTFLLMVSTQSIIEMARVHVHCPFFVQHVEAFP